MLQLILVVAKWLVAFLPAVQRFLGL